MIFTSVVFMFAFSPLVLIGWWTLRRPRSRLAFLTLASYFFYGWWDWRFLPVLLLPTMVDYTFGGAIARGDARPGASNGRRRKILLAAAITLDLSSLVFFKYSGFFLDSLNGLGALVGYGQPFPGIEVVLPLGISFYTFNSLSYTIDIYRRRVEPAQSLVHYAAFVAMFPHLIAGPIVRFSDMDWQLRRLTARLDWRLVAAGVFFFGCGLVKKLLIADTLDPTVDHLFAAGTHLGLVGGWAAALSYSLQLYFDFSGYSDMAVGLAFLLGFRFPQNFDSPFKATNISDFWRRWHMTMSFWFRDYVYISMGGSRHGKLATLRNLVITMFLAGLWHGAAWTFVVWGLAHGVLLAAHAVLKGAGLTPRSVVVNRVLTFLAVISLFVVFRAETLTRAGQVYRAMIGLNGLDTAAFSTQVGWLVGGFLLALLVFVNAAPNTWQVESVGLRARHAVALGLATGAAILLMSHPTPFLYFQF